MLAKTFWENPFTVTILGGIIVAAISFFAFHFIGKPVSKYINSKKIIQKINKLNQTNLSKLNEVLEECISADELTPDSNGHYTFTLNNPFIRGIRTYGILNKELAIIIKKADVLANENIPIVLNDLLNSTKHNLLAYQKDLSYKDYSKITNKTAIIENTIDTIEDCPFEVILENSFFLQGDHNFIKTKRYKTNKNTIEHIESLIKNCSTIIE